MILKDLFTNKSHLFNSRFLSEFCGMWVGGGLFTHLSSQGIIEQYSGKQQTSKKGQRIYSKKVVKTKQQWIKLVPHHQKKTYTINIKI